jgi:hypothetical protein
MDTTPNLNLPWMLPSQSDKHVTYNQAIGVLDVMAQTRVTSRTLVSPPSQPQDGTQYIVPPGATGLWSDFVDHLCRWQDGGWHFYAPRQGWLVWVIAEARQISWTGQAWVVPSVAATGSTGDVQYNNAGILSPSTLTFDGVNQRLGLQVTTPAHTIHVHKLIAERATAAIAITGPGLFGPTGSGEGVGLFLTHNNTNNRQFALLSTDTRIGVRVVATTYPILDGYMNGVRADLRIGTNTNGVHINEPVGTAQFSVSNIQGDANKTLIAGEGASGQVGPLMSIRKSATSGISGDALTLTSTGKLGVAGITAPVSELEVGGAIRPASFLVAGLPSASSKGAGAMIFVSNESGGPVIAFSDGTAWRRCTDRNIVS